MDIMEGILKGVNMLEYGKAAVENQYKRAVSRNGNLEVRALIGEVFEEAEREWRGIGVVSGAGYALKSDFAAYDAHLAFEPQSPCQVDGNGCISAEIWRGLKNLLSARCLAKPANRTAPREPLCYRLVVPARRTINTKSKYKV